MGTKGARHPDKSERVRLKKRSHGLRKSCSATKRTVPETVTEQFGLAEEL